MSVMNVITLVPPTQSTAAERRQRRLASRVNLRIRKSRRDGSYELISTTPVIFSSSSLDEVSAFLELVAEAQQ